MAVQAPARRASPDANGMPAQAQAGKHSVKIPSLGCTKCRYAPKGCRKCRAERQSALQVRPTTVAPRQLQPLLYQLITCLLCQHVGCVCVCCLCLAIMYVSWVMCFLIKCLCSCRSASVNQDTACKQHCCCACCPSKQYSRTGKAEFVLVYC